MSSTTPRARLAHTVAAGRYRVRGSARVVSRWHGPLRLQTPAENRVGFPNAR